MVRGVPFYQPFHRDGRKRLPVCVGVEINLCKISGLQLTGSGRCSRNLPGADGCFKTFIQKRKDGKQPATLRL